jgi:lysophospholipase L1-like esterase
LSYCLVGVGVFLWGAYYFHISSENFASFVHLRKEYPIPGAWDKVYMSDHQKLSEERLNLNAWGGFHELKLDKKFYQKELNVSFKVNLSPSSYIYIYLDRSDEEKSYGVRLSRNTLYPSLFFIRNGNGEFVFREEIDYEPEKELNHIEILYTPSKVEIKSNQHSVLIRDDLKKIFDGGVSLAFGGSFEKTPVWIDDILIKDEQGETLYQTSFGMFEELFSRIGTLLTFFALSVCLFLISRISDSTWKVTTGFSLAFMLLVLYFVYYDEFSKMYYKNVEQFNYDPIYRKLKAESKSRLEQTEKKKIFIFGGSKARGDGARKTEDRWSNILQRNIDSVVDGIELFNWGMPAALSKDILRLREDLAQYNPSLMIILTGVNDYVLTDFVKNVHTLIELNKRDGIKTILIEESTYINDLNQLKENQAFNYFQAIKAFCKDTMVECLELFDEMYNTETRLYDQGIRWVEWVHLTSFGQYQFAQMITPGILREIQKL